MKINVSLEYNGGFLADIILLTLLSMLLPSRNPIKCHEEVLSWQRMFPPTKRFGNFAPYLGDAQKV